MTQRSVAVVTGAAGGIGSAIVRTLLTDGWAVIGVDQASPPVDLTGTTTRLDWAVGDVGDPALAARAVAAAGRLGELRGLVTATLTETRGHLEDLDRTEVTRVLDLQATAAWAWGAEVAAAVGPQGGAIVHVSSVHAERAGAGMAAYAMAKAALGALTRATALEWGPRGVRCNAVLPGFVPVPRNAHRWNDPEGAAALLAHHPLGRFVRPEDVAAAVAFLLGPQAAGVTGATVPVDGGMLAVLPDWA